MNKRNRTARFLSFRSMYVLHGWLGFKLSILMFVICLSGAVATMASEIQWLVRPELHTSFVDSEVNWIGIEKSMRRAFPDSKIGFISAPLYSGFPAVAARIDPERDPRYVYIDPVDGHILQDVAWFSNFWRLIRDFHRLLLFPIGGLYIATSFAFVLLGSLIAGIVIYKKWWRQFFRLRIGKSARIFWADLHKLIGVWSLWFIAIISITGVWYFVEAAISDAGIRIQHQNPTLTNEQVNELGAAPARIDLGTALGIVRAEMPDLYVRNIVFPTYRGQLFNFEGQTSTLLVRNRSNAVHVNPYDGTIMKVRRTADNSIFARWIDTADALHMGDFGGITTKIIWFVFGLAVPVLTLTGTWLWWKRVRRLAMQKNGLDLKSMKREYDQKDRMGLYKPLALALLSVVLILGVLDISYRSSAINAPPRSQALDSQHVGPWLVTLYGSDANLDGNKDTFRLSVMCGLCIPNYATAEIGRPADGKDMILESFDLIEQGYRYSPTAFLSDVTDNHENLIEITTHSGESYSAWFTDHSS